MDAQLDPAERPDSRDEINLFVYLHVLLKWKRFILINIVVIAVIAAGFSLLLPNTYKSAASVIAPRQENGIGGALSQLTKDIVPSGLLGKLNVPQGVYNYLAILESRRTMEAVVKKFNLLSVYDIKSGSMERAVKRLAGNAFFDIEKNGNITITVVDESPLRAADMANYFVLTLNEVSIELGTQEARNNRLFLERRYRQAQDDMRLIEDSLRQFQERYGIYALPEQIKAAIEEVAQVHAQATVSEMELGILERSLGTGNPQTRLKISEIEELNRKLRSLKFGSNDGATKEDLSLFVPLKSVPELGMRYLRLYRNFEIQNKILQFIIPLYEQARVDEQKDLPAVLVLDKAYPPERKDGPKRSLIVLVAIILGLFLFSFIVLVFESFRAKQRVLTPVEVRLRRYIGGIARFYKIRDAGA
jgi:tyrosine-protein kinase Etk/Wzc